MSTRRDLIKLGLYGGAGGILHLTRLDSGLLAWALDEKGGTSGKGTMQKIKTGGTFGNGKCTLPLPPVAQPVAPFATAPAGATCYDVNMALGAVNFFGPTSPPTHFWGYDPVPLPNVAPTIRGHLGPTFVAKIGEATVVRMRNNLPLEATAIVHHHGGHTPSVSDGSALWTQQIPNAAVVGSALGFKDYIYPNDDDISATHWYHDHDIDVTGHNVWFGLQGLFLLWDDVERALNLPGNPVTDPPAVIGGVTHAPFELPIVIQDREFDANNEFVWDPFNHDGMLGNMFLVNGAIQPNVTVANRRYRLRLLNGCNCRFYNLSFSDPNVEMWVIGSDGGLRQHPVQVSSVPLAPAERIELIVDFSKVQPGPNTQVFLINCLAQTGGRGPDGLASTCTTNIPGGDGVGAILLFNVTFSWPDNSFNPATQTTLRTDQPILGPGGWDPNAPGVVNRTWNFQRSNGAWQINNQFFDPGPAPTGPPRIDATVQHGATEIWTLVNQGGGWYHPIHIHRNQFYMLDRNGSAANLQPHEQNSLKDVFTLADNDVVRVITRYDGIVTDTQGLYVMHCHNVEHEDMRMMVAWQVLPPV